MNDWLNKYRSTTLVSSIMILLSYVIVRAAIQYFLSYERGFNPLTVDALLNVPRLLGLFVTIYIFHKTEKFNYRISYDHLLLAAIVFLILSSWVYLQSKYVVLYSLDNEQLLLFSIGSFIVGFFEESLFRGLLLTELEKKMSYFSSLLVMSGIFTIYHYGMQPIYTFPSIFMFGILTGQLKKLKVSLFWLGLFHGFYDMTWGIWYPAGELSTSLLVLEFLLTCTLNVIIFAYGRSRHASC
jgi:membrane protease YdiL (CAAX protease family)